MNFFKGLLMLTLLTASVAGQIEHAPTVAQCQADQRLWLSEIEDTDSTTQPLFSILGQRSHEMSQCEDVDPANRFKYYNTHSEIIAAQTGRMYHYLVRHDLWGRFLTEDAMGLR